MRISTRTTNVNVCWLLKKEDTYQGNWYYIFPTKNYMLPVPFCSTRPRSRMPSRCDRLHIVSGGYDVACILLVVSRVLPVQGVWLGRIHSTVDDVQLVSDWMLYVKAANYCFSTNRFFKILVLSCDSWIQAVCWSLPGRKVKSLRRIKKLKEKIQKNTFRISKETGYIYLLFKIGNFSV